MEIKYIGHSCFEIKGKDAVLVIDPYDPKYVGFDLPKLKSDITLATHDHKDHHYIEGVAPRDTVGTQLVIDGAGEYEKQGVFILGIETFHDAKGGSVRGKNVIYSISIDGLCLLHLGDLGHELSQDMLERLPDVDVLFIPVGGKYTIDAEKATKVISSLEPGIVVPMHYSTKDLAFAKDLDTLDDFLDEMGIENGDAKKQEVLKLNSVKDIPQETEVRILKPQH